MKFEKTMWHPSGHQGPGLASETRKVVEAMQVGDCIRLVHDDVSCRKIKVGYMCTVASIACRVRKEGWAIEYYHEGPGVCVIRRLK